MISKTSGLDIVGSLTRPCCSSKISVTEDSSKIPTWLLRSLPTVEIRLVPVGSWALRMFIRGFRKDGWIETSNIEYLEPGEISI